MRVGTVGLAIIYVFNRFLKGEITPTAFLEIMQVMTSVLGLKPPEDVATAIALATEVKKLAMKNADDFALVAELKRRCLINNPSGLSLP